MKLAKLSLAAIMTVGALSAANAGSLEESIKGVDFSGFARYRYNNVQKSTAGSYAAGNDYDVLTKFVAPVTDDIKFTAALRAKGDNDNKNAGTGKLSYDMTKAFFTYAKNGLTIKAGKQTIATPWNDTGYGGDRGDGIIATYGMDNVTFAGAYFNGGTLASSNNAFADTDFNPEVNVAAVIGSFGMVNAQLWALRASNNTVDSSFFLQVDGKIAGFSLMGQAVSTKVDSGLVVATAAAGSSITDDSGMFYGLKAGYAMDNFAVNAGFTSNDDEQPFYTLNPDGSMIFPGWRLGYNTTNERDVDTMFADVGATFGKIGLKIGYAEAKFGSKHVARNGAGSDSYTVKGAAGNTVVTTLVPGSAAGVSKADEKDKEIWGQVSYKVSKNLNTYAKYSDLNSGIDAQDQKYFRFEAKYSF